VTIGLQTLRHLPGVRTATVFGQSMHLLVEEGMSEQVIRTELARVKISTVDIRPIAPSLEDVFVALTNNIRMEGRRKPSNHRASSLSMLNLDPTLLNPAGPESKIGIKMKIKRETA
jgi:hypothetical protein